MCLKGLNKTSKSMVDTPQYRDRSSIWQTDLHDNDFGKCMQIKYITNAKAESECNDIVSENNISYVCNMMTCACDHNQPVAYS